MDGKTTYHIQSVSFGKYLCEKEGELYYSTNVGEAMGFDTKNEAKEQIEHTPGGKLEHCLTGSCD